MSIEEHGVDTESELLAGISQPRIDLVRGCVLEANELFEVLSRALVAERLQVTYPGAGRLRPAVSGFTLSWAAIRARSSSGVTSVCR